jgi:hypothetical protein
MNQRINESINSIDAWSKALRFHLLDEFRATAYRLYGIKKVDPSKRRKKRKRRQASAKALLKARAAESSPSSSTSSTAKDLRAPKRTIVRIIIYSDDAGGDEELDEQKEILGDHFALRKHRRLENADTVKKDLSWWCLDHDKDLKRAARLRTLKRERAAAAIKYEALRVGATASEVAMAEALNPKDEWAEALLGLGVECSIQVVRGGLLQETLSG